MAGTGSDGPDRDGWRDRVGAVGDAPPGLPAAVLLPREPDEPGRVDDLPEGDLRLADHADVDQLGPAGLVGCGQADLVGGLPVAVLLDLAGLLADHPRPRLGDAHERQPG